MLSWFGKKDVNTLISRGQYGRAIRVLEDLLAEEPDSIHLRQLLADVLARDGRKQRAVEVLESLVHEFSSEGFVTKAIAVLKKIQRIDPQQTDAAEMIETLIKVRSKQSGKEEAPARGFSLPQLGRAQKPATTPEEHVGFVTSEIKLSESWFQEAAEERDDFHWSPLFGDFSPGELEAMIGGLRLLIKKPGSIIYTEGEPGYSLFVLANGAARVYQRNQVGHNVQIEVLRGGEVFGTPAVFSEARRDSTVTAVTECELLELDRSTFESIVESHPRIRDLVQEIHERRWGDL